MNKVEKGVLSGKIRQAQLFDCYNNKPRVYPTNVTYNNINNILTNSTAVDQKKVFAFFPSLPFFPSSLRIHFLAMYLFISSQDVTSECISRSFQNTLQEFNNSQTFQNPS